MSTPGTDYQPLHADSPPSSTSQRAPPVQSLPEPALPPPAYPFSHPKAYVGAVAAVATTDTRASACDAITTHVINAADRALRGAARLNLITLDNANNPQLTARGETVHRHLCLEYDTATDALTALEALQGTQTRFLALGTTYPQLARVLATADPALAYLTSLIDRAYAHDGFTGPYTLPTLVTAAFTVDPAFTVATFIRHTDAARSAVLTETEDGHPRLRSDALAQPDVYRGTVTQQTKSILYHLGVLAAPGTDVGSLDPTAQQWQRPQPAGDSPTDSPPAPR